MINMEKMRQVLTQYKADFPTYWHDEEYKWEAVKHFKTNWDINAADFGAMFKEATRKTKNLLNSLSAYPGSMICDFAKADNNATREMFRALFDDSNDLAERVKAFQETARGMWTTHNAGRPPNDRWKSHFQNTNAISTYLWLNNPDKYFIYKYQLVKAAAAELSADFTPKADGSVESMIGGYRLYDEIRAAVKADESVCELIRDAVSRNPDCYADPEFVTTAIDVAYYLAKRYGKSHDQPAPEEAAEPENGGEPPYTEQDFFEKDHVYMDKPDYEDLKGLLLFKKNVILQGAPGVGKTFAAKKLAYSILGTKDDSRIEFVQFHQNYSYEDFVMGYRPNGDKFKLKTGVFYDFCRKAAGDPSNKYVFIIDEINRGNMSKIFGELLMLIENDKRGREWSVALAYGNNSEENDGQETSDSSISRRFFVPENVYIIGMMNTADRSLAMIDYALRRRFSFFEMKPAFDYEGFKEYQREIGYAKFDELIKTIKELNGIIEKDPALGLGFRIGHSYFCNKEPNEVSEDWMKRIVKYEIVPLLQEYWFDELAGEQDRKKKWEIWEENLLQAIQSSTQQESQQSPPETPSDDIAEGTAEQ